MAQSPPKSAGSQRPDRSYDSLHTSGPRVQRMVTQDHSSRGGSIPLYRLPYPISKVPILLVTPAGARTCITGLFRNLRFNGQGGIDFGDPALESGRGAGLNQDNLLPKAATCGLQGWKRASGHAPGGGRPGNDEQPDRTGT